MVAATVAMGVAALIAVTAPAQRQVPLTVVAAHPRLHEPLDGARIRFPAVVALRSPETIRKLNLFADPDVEARLATFDFAPNAVFLIIDHRRPYLGHELKPLRAFVKRGTTLSWLRLHVASCLKYPGAYLHMEHTPYAIVAVDRRHLPSGRLRVAVSYPEGAYPTGGRSPGCARPR